MPSIERWKFYGARDDGFTYYQGKTTPADGTWVVPEIEVERLRDVADDAYRSLKAGRLAETEEYLRGMLRAR